MLRPVDDDWQETIKKKIKKLEKGNKKSYFSWNPLVWISTFFELLLQDPEESIKESPKEEEHDQIDDEGLMKEKVKKTGYSLVIRIITTGNDALLVESQLQNIISSFSQFASPAYNRFKKIKYKSLELLIRNYIFRQFSWIQREDIMNSEEISTLYHFPHSKYNRQPEIRWQNFKIVKAPTNLPKE